MFCFVIVRRMFGASSGLSKAVTDAGGPKEGKKNRIEVRNRINTV